MLQLYFLNIYILALIPHCIQDLLSHETEDCRTLNATYQEVYGNIVTSWWNLIIFIDS